MSRQLSGLKIVAWNAGGGIQAKKAEIEHFLAQHNVDIMLLSETLLKSSDKFKFVNYRTYKSRRNTSCRGTALLIRNEISHHEIPLSLEQLEATAVIIKIRGENIGIVSLYNSPSIDFYKNDYDKIFRISNTVIAAGDFNSKHTAWGSRQYNIRGNDLLEYTLNNNLFIQAPEDFTFFPHNPKHKPDLLDIAVFKNLNTPINVRTVRELYSDHYPIEITLGTEATRITPIKYNTAEADWEKFATHINDKLPKNQTLNSPQDVDRDVEFLTDTITEALEISCPPRINRVNKPPLPDRIKKLIDSRNNLRNEINKRPDPFKKSEVRSLQREIDYQIRVHETDTWTKKLSSLKIQDNSLWQMTKIFTRSRINIAPLKDDNSELKYFSPTDKANRFAEHFAKQLSPHDDPQDHAFTAFTDKRVKKFLASNSPVDFNETTINELKSVLKKFKNNKAPGLDNITNIVLKNLPPIALKFLVEIINSCMKLNYFPTQWKKAKILVIPKAGKDLTIASSYRPISLLITMSKAFEAILLRRINIEVHGRNLLRPEQFGFRAGHCTQQQVLRLAEKVTFYFNKGYSTGAVFLDVAKAFDSVWINGLIAKLIDLEFPPNLIKLIHSYLSDRFFCVTVDDVLSELRPATAGVPQGSLIGPVLFILCIH